jgi:hypothetical protein
MPTKQAIFSPSIPRALGLFLYVSIAIYGIYASPHLSIKASAPRQLLRTSRTHGPYRHSSSKNHHKLINQTVRIGPPVALFSYNVLLFNE